MGVSFTITAADLRTLIRCVGSAANKDDFRPVIQNVLIERRKGEPVKVVATDSFRMHVATLNDGILTRLAPAAKPFTVMLPYERLSYWARQRHAKGDTVDIVIGDERGVLEDSPSGNALTFPVMDATKFPKWRDVIDDVMTATGIEEVAVNSKLLSATLAAGGAWGDDSTSTIIVERLAMLRPCRFSNVGRLGTLDLVLMPVRSAVLEQRREARKRAA
jgi:hypothetical protein